MHIQFTRTACPILHGIAHRRYNCLGNRKIFRNIILCDITSCVYERRQFVFSYIIYNIIECTAFYLFLLQTAIDKLPFPLRHDQWKGRIPIVMILLLLMPILPYTGESGFHVHANVYRGSPLRAFCALLIHYSSISPILCSMNFLKPPSIFEEKT